MVGGAVRDRLLGQTAADRDWLVLGESDATMRARGFKPVGKQFRAYLHPRTGEEYALPRGQTVGSDAEVIRADLEARDLTINAMAIAEDGALFDPFAGAADLKTNTLRHVSERFADDPLRVLRVIRFAAQFGFSVAQQTRIACQELCATGALLRLPPARVAREWLRALPLHHPDAMLDAFVQTGAAASLLPALVVPADSGLIPKRTLATALRRAQFAQLCSDQLASVFLAAVPAKAASEACTTFGLSTGQRRLVQVVHAATPTYIAPTLDAEAALRLLEQADAFRQSSLLQPALAVCEVLAEVLQVDKTLHQSRSAVLRRANTAAQRCKADGLQIQADGLRGPEVGVRLREARFAAISSVLADNT